MNKFIALSIVFMISGCTKHPITDEQARLFSELCDKRGGSIDAFNSIMVPRMDCVNK